MNIRRTLARFTQQEDLNFLLTNRIPRNLVTRLVGRFSRIENPLVCRLSIAVWKLFADLDLSEARTTEFRSMHDCFTRQLRDGARPFDPDPDVLASPCDAIVGAHGKVEGTRLFQAKGFPYTLQDLLGDSLLVERYRDGCYATLRLTSTMYHRFHAPYDGTVDHITYRHGDTWNVNPIALRRVEKLFCKNERAVIRMRLATPPRQGAAPQDDGGTIVTLVPVAAILVASIRLNFVDVLLHLGYRGPTSIPCQARLRKGEEMGWFQHGSTIIVFAPAGFAMAEGLTEGSRIKAGQALMRMGGATAR